jgi:hypothetical protein
MTAPAPWIKTLRSAAFALALCAAMPAQAGEVLKKAPLRPDSTKFYLFYLHGAYVERHGTDDRYQYREILLALAEKGFSVIGEIRSPGGIGRYARELAAQVRHLLDNGVPSWHIGVAGHSRGGFIALVTAARLARRDIRFGILAACGLPGTPFRRAYDRFVDRDAANLQGRFLVMWDQEDRVAADCDKAFAAARPPFENKVLTGGEGHELFYKPDKHWIDPLAAFLRAK